MTVDPTLLQYYADLLILQYRNKPRAIDTIKNLVDNALCDGLPQELQTAFNLDTAVGDQLTIIGKIVGVPRNVIGLDLEHTFFSFTDYDGEPASIGFGSYDDDPYGSDLFLSYFDTATYTLTDAEMRVLIKLAIVNNTVWTSLTNLKNALWGFFAGLINVDEGTDWSNIYFNFTDYNGEPASIGFGSYTDDPQLVGPFFSYSGYNPFGIIYTVSNTDPYVNAFAAAIFLGIVPKPMGVASTTVYV